jgi:hypothetical protein
MIAYAMTRKRGRVPASGGSVATPVWLLFGATALTVLLTYAWRPTAELYHVSVGGLAGGLGRTLVYLNYPIALAAIAIVLVLWPLLDGRERGIGAVACALCAVTVVAVDQDDLDARWINVVPALGVALALGLTLAATRRAGASFTPRLRFDFLRLALAGAALLVSVPWIAALLGVYLPEGIFVMERPGVENGTTIAAVHLGQHHGFMGTVLVWSALLLSRPAVAVRGRLGSVLRAYLSVAFAYGAVNLAQDAWNEQLWKRNLVDAKIPSALLPAFEPIWLVTLALACGAVLVLGRERRRAAPV